MQILPYVSSPAKFEPYDPAAKEIALKLAEAIRQVEPRLQVEHVGSTSVPGCGGKGVIDLAVLYPEGLLAAARAALGQLGFQKQGGPEPFPEERPMRVGSVEHQGRTYRIHAHVIPLDCDEHHELIWFRDRLRLDSAMRARYEEQKQAILALGIHDSLEYCKAKGAFVAGVLKTRTCEHRLRETLKQLAIPVSFLTHYRLPPQPECDDLISIGRDMFDREQRMERHAAAQWQAMVAAAKSDGVTLLGISAFRSFDYQRGIIERKLAAGLTLEQITRASALPGFSEHHTGRAIDIGTGKSQPLTEEFEQTPAFDWLKRRAGEFSFSMSYPRDNAYGIIHEPWHWMFRASEVAPSADNLGVGR